MSGTFEKRRAAFRASKTSFAAVKRKSSMSARRSVKEIQKIARTAGETKYRITATGVVPLDIPYYYLVNGIPQGDSASQREGSRVNCKSLEIRGLASATSSTVEPTSAFWALIEDRQPNGAGFTIGDVYDLGGSGDPVIAMRNQDKIERFKVLAREDFTIGFTYGGTIQNGSGVPSQLAFHKYVDLSKLNARDSMLRYSGSGSTITALQTNSLYLVVVPSNQTAFSAGSLYQNTSFEVKLNFSDI